MGKKERENANQKKINLSKETSLIFCKFAPLFFQQSHPDSAEIATHLLLVFPKQKNSKMQQPVQPKTAIPDLQRLGKNNFLK